MNVTVNTDIRAYVVHHSDNMCHESLVQLYTGAIRRGVVEVPPDHGEGTVLIPSLRIVSVCIPQTPVSTP